jgi:four helix bundle protein
MDKIERIEAMKKRTKAFAVRVVKLFQKLPKTDEARILGKQLLRSATSVTANYRASCRARSDRELFAKISIVVEEADEALFWLELLVESEIVEERKLKELMTESEELVKIMNSVRYKLKG